MELQLSVQDPLLNWFVKLEELGDNIFKNGKFKIHLWTNIFLDFLDWLSLMPQRIDGEKSLGDYFLVWIVKALVLYMKNQTLENSTQIQ